MTHSVSCPLGPQLPDKGSMLANSLPHSSVIKSGLGLLMVLMALFVMIQYSTSGVLNPDFHLHILNGQWIIGHYALPERDIFTWTASGMPYVLTQWGSEVIMAIAWLLAGGWGTKVLTALVACGLLYVMYRTANIQFRDVFGSTAATVLLAGGTLLSLQARPEIFSYLLFAGIVLVTECWREDGRNKALFWLPPILMVWANLDGGYVVGLLFLVISTIGMGIGFGFKNHSPREFWRVSPFAIATLVAGIVTMINPYGVGSWDAVLSAARSASAQSAVVSEWASPTLGDRAGIQLAIVVIMMAAAAGFSRRRLRTEEFLIFAAFLVFGFAAKANVPFFMMTMVPILSRLGAATDFADWARPKVERKTSLVAQVTVAVVALPILFLSGIVIKEEGEKSFRKTFSIPALVFLVENKMTDRVMHGFDGGGYFAYSAGMKTFADRRTQLFGNRFITGYDNAVNGREGYLDFIRAWDPKAIVLPTASPLKTLLTAGGGYGVVFDSSTDAIITKRGIGHDDLIAKASRP